MTKRNIPFSPPDISDLEIAEVAEVLRSGWITTGPHVKLLERRIAAYIETGKTDVDTEKNPEYYSNRVICLNSATAAEEMNLRILGIRDGDEVIVPSYTYTATASAAIHCGATVKFIDIQKDGDPVSKMPEMDYDALEKAITPKTKAIVPVDIGGIVCDYKRLYSIVEKKRDMFTPIESDGTPLGDLSARIQKSIGRIAIVADCAHSLGASRVIDGKRKYCGELADFSSFSFHAVKNFTTAEGGASTWLPIKGVDNSEIYKMLQLLSMHGQNKDALAKTRIGAWEYDIIGPWYKCNMTDIMGAIGLKQLDRYSGMLKRRKEIIEKYDETCDELGIARLVHHTCDMDSSNHLYLIRIPGIGEEDRNMLISRLAELGVAANVHYKPLPLMTAYGKDCSAYPNSYDYYKNLITLPLHTLLSDEDADYVCESLKTVTKDIIKREKASITRAFNQADDRLTSEITDTPTKGNTMLNKTKLTPLEKHVHLAIATPHPEMMEYIKYAFDENYITTEGTNVKEVERIAAEKAGVKYAVGLSCCTAALHLCVKAAGERLYGKPAAGKGAIEGKRVFCSDMTFGASANPISYEHGIPVFIDTERDTWNMDPVALEKAFEMYPDVKLVMFAHLYGFPGKIDEIKAICEKHGALLIEDAAEAMGAVYKGKQCGSFGDYAAVSYNGNKIITGSAGGCLLTNDLETANRARKWATQAREAAPWYQHEEVGFNYRLSNIVAGCIRGQYPHLEEHISQKKTVWERYKEGLKDLPVQMNPWDGKTSVPNYWLSAMIVDKDAMCKQVRSDNETVYIREQGKTCPTEILDAITYVNAEGRPIWKPMHMQPIYRMHEFVTVNGSGRCRTNAYIKGGFDDVGADIFNRGLCLPSDNNMTKDQQDVIIEAIRRCFE